MKYEGVFKYYFMMSGVEDLRQVDGTTFDDGLPEKQLVKGKLDQRGRPAGLSVQIL